MRQERERGDHEIVPLIHSSSDSDIDAQPSTSSSTTNTASSRTRSRSSSNSATASVKSNFQSISPKLVVAFVIVAVLCVYFGAFFFRRPVKIYANLDEILENATHPKKEREDFHRAINSFELSTAQLPSLRFVIIPMGGFGNKLRSMGRMFGFAEGLGPKARRRHIYVNWNVTREVRWNDVWATPTAKQWGYTEVSYGFDDINSYRSIQRTQDTKPKKPPSIPRLCVWAGGGDNASYVKGWASVTIAELGFPNPDRILGKDFDYNDIADCHTVVLASAWGFKTTKKGFEYTQRLLRELDVVEPVKARMDPLLKRLKRTDRLVGVHLRETDIPTDSRVELVDAVDAVKLVMENEMQNNTRIFVSSDTAQGVQLMLDAFPGRVIVQENTSHSRDSLRGLQDGAVDLLLLASTDQIVCTSLVSTFSEMATRIQEAKTRQYSNKIIYLPTLLAEANALRQEHQNQNQNQQQEQKQEQEEEEQQQKAADVH